MNDCDVDDLCRLLWRTCDTLRTHDIDEDLAVELDRKAVGLAASIGLTFNDFQEEVVGGLSEERI